MVLLEVEIDCARFGKMAIFVFFCLYLCRVYAHLVLEILSSCKVQITLTDASWLFSGNYKHYEYIATYVDNFVLTMKDPKAFISQFESTLYNFKLKGSGPLTFQLRCGFKRDSACTLYMDPGKYIDQTEEECIQHFGTKPQQKHRSHLQKSDHSEIDTALFLSEEDKEVYQSLVGSSQCNISVGRFDTQLVIMIMSKICTAPRRGHLKRI